MENLFLGKKLKLLTPNVCVYVIFLYEVVKTKFYYRLNDSLRMMTVKLNFCYSISCNLGRFIFFSQTISLPTKHETRTIFEVFFLIHYPFEKIMQIRIIAMFKCQRTNWVRAYTTFFIL